MKKKRGGIIFIFPFTTWARFYFRTEVNRVLWCSSVEKYLSSGICFRVKNCKRHLYERGWGRHYKRRKFCRTAGRLIPTCPMATAEKFKSGRDTVNRNFFEKEGEREREWRVIHSCSTQVNEEIVSWLKWTIKTCCPLCCQNFERDPKPWAGHGLNLRASPCHRSTPLRLTAR